MRIHSKAFLPGSLGQGSNFSTPTLQEGAMKSDVFTLPRLKFLVTSTKAWWEIYWESGKKKDLMKVTNFLFMVVFEW
jgi:hypothetical protein